MIKISNLAAISSTALLANSTAVIPISTGNTIFVTYKTTVSSIGQYILSNAGNITSGNIINSGNITTSNLQISSNLLVSGTVTTLSVLSTNANVTNTLIASNANVTNNAYIGGNTWIRGLVVGNVSSAANGWIYTNNFNANTGIGFGDYGSATLANTGTIEFSRWSGGYAQSIFAQNTGNLIVYNAVNGISFNVLGLSATKVHIRNTTGNLEVFSNIIVTTGNINATNVIVSSNVKVTNKTDTQFLNVSGSADIWRANIATLNLSPEYDYIDQYTVSAGSPDPTGGSQCYIDSTGGALAATLGDGITNGFIKYFFMYVDGGDCTLTVTKAAWKGGASGTVTFNDVGDTCTLMWFENKWFIMGNYGVIIA